jgi:hypothetical protein
MLIPNITAMNCLAQEISRIIESPVIISINKKTAECNKINTINNTVTLNNGVRGTGYIINGSITNAKILVKGIICTPVKNGTVSNCIVRIRRIPIIT